MNTACREICLNSTLAISNNITIKKNSHVLCHAEFPRWLNGKEYTCQCRRLRVNPWVRNIPWSRKWQPVPVFMPGNFHGQRFLGGYRSWGHKESDTTEHSRMHYAMYQLTMCKLIIFHGLPSTNAHHKLCNNSVFLFTGKKTILIGDTQLFHVLGSIQRPLIQSRTRTHPLVLLTLNIHKFICLLTFKCETFTFLK